MESTDPLTGVDVVVEVDDVSKPVTGILLSTNEANLASVSSGFLYNLESVFSMS